MKKIKLDAAKLQLHKEKVTVLQNLENVVGGFVTSDFYTTVCTVSKITRGSCDLSCGPKTPDMPTLHSIGGYTC